jgi:ABC-2 type transport system permease protein
MISPLRPLEFVLSLMAMSVIRLMVGFFPVTIAAIWFFGFNLWGLGIALAVFFLNLFLTAWAMGMLCSGLVLRHGMGAEGLTWSLMFILLPLACVYYPVTTLPVWLQPVAWALPPTAVFEGMRALVLQHTFHPELMLWAFGLNVLWFAAGAISFFWLLRGARTAGSLISVGE